MAVLVKSRRPDRRIGKAERNVDGVIPGPVGTLKPARQPVMMLFHSRGTSSTFTPMAQVLLGSFMGTGHMFPEPPADKRWSS